MSAKDLEMTRGVGDTSGAGLIEFVAAMTMSFDTGMGLMVLMRVSS